MKYIKLYESFIKQESKYYDEYLDGGSIQGIIHYDNEYIYNWFYKRNINPNEYKEYLNNKTVAFLNNINVDDSERGKGYGFQLYDMFEDFCIENEADIIILESDSPEEQSEGFILDEWYLKLGFEIIGNESGNNIMIKYLEE